MNHFDYDENFDGLEEIEAEDDDELEPIPLNFPKISIKVLELFDKYQCPLSLRSCTDSFLWDGKTLATTWTEISDSFSRYMSATKHTRFIDDHFLLNQLGHWLITADWEREYVEFGMPLLLKGGCTGDLSVKDQQIMGDGVFSKADRSDRTMKAFLLGYEFCLITETHIPAGWLIKNLNREKFLSEWARVLPDIQQLGFKLKLVSKEIKEMLKISSNEANSKQSSYPTNHHFDGLSKKKGRPLRLRAATPMVLKPEPKKKEYVRSAPAANFTRSNDSFKRYEPSEGWSYSSAQQAASFSNKLEGVVQSTLDKCPLGSKWQATPTDKIWTVIGYSEYLGYVKLEDNRSFGTSATQQILDPSNTLFHLSNRLDPVIAAVIPVKSNDALTTMSGPKSDVSPPPRMPGTSWIIVRKD
jgi:hypothetical protein